MTDHQRGVVDALVLSEIKSGNYRNLTITSAVKAHLDLPKGKDPMRAVDEALQRLRKSGHIKRLVGKMGWQLTVKSKKAA